MKGKLVTVKNWYMPRRVFGRIVGGDKRFVFVKGSFGLGEFHRSTVRPVKVAPSSN